MSERKMAGGKEATEKIQKIAMLEHPLLRRIGLFLLGYVSPVPIEVWLIMYYVAKWKMSAGSY